MNHSIKIERESFKARSLITVGDFGTRGHPVPGVRDVAIDRPYAGRQARRLGHPLRREVQVLLAHGILHLLGHDHETDAGEMFALQRTVVLRAFGAGPDGVPPGEKGAA